MPPNININLHCGRSVIYDVQLWGQTPPEDGQTLNPQRWDVVDHINPHRIALWMVQESYTVYTLDSSTVDFMERHLSSDVGLLIVKDQQHIVIYKADKVYASRLTFEHAQYSAQIPKKQAKSATIDEVLERQREQQKLFKEKVSQSSMHGDIKEKNKNNIQRCILSGLRLRGIGKENPEFVAIYKMTYKSVEFSFRAKLKNYQVLDISALRDCVETLLECYVAT